MQDDSMPAARPAPPTGQQMLRRLWFYLRPYRVRLFWGLLAATAAGLIQTGVFLLLRKFIKTLTATGIGLEAQKVQLALVCLGVVAAYALLWIMRFGQSILLAQVAQKVGLAMRRDVYIHLQRMSLAYFHRRRTGALMSTLTNDVPKLQDAAMKIKDVVATPIQALSALVTMFVLSWRLTLFALLVVPAMIGVVQLITRRLRSISNETQERMADVTAVMEETLSAPRIVRAFSAEEREIHRFEGVNQIALAMQMRSIRRNSRLAPTVDLLGACGIALTLWVGGSQVIAGRIGFEELATFILLVSTLSNSVGLIGNLRGAWEEMMGAADRIFSDVLDVEPDVSDAPDATPIGAIAGRIEFENVGFAYEPGKPVLRDISFTAQPGQVVALVGQTGAGKSTLADLVPRFYDTTHGAVLIDGRDIRTVALASLRRQIGIVPQETLLFSGTIRDNIAYGRPDASDAEVEAAARASNAASFIEGYPLRYQTVIGERGQTLSGGERQRIAIARALLADPRILILDEATSSLDASTEALVQEALDVLMQGRTTIVIAHRLSTIVNADKIVVLRKGGTIAEMGTHSELIGRGGMYAALYETQKRHAELSAVALSEA